MRVFPVDLVLPDAQVIRLEVGEDESIWDAAARTGLVLPHTCLQGWCISCAGVVLSGEWDQSGALRYYPADREAGFILLCTARPRSPLRVATHEKEAMQAHRIARGLPAPRG